MVEFTVKCLPGGAWEYPDEWPQCLPCESEFLAKSVHFQNLNVLAVNCTDPPEKPGAGTWQWNGSFEYQTKISYTCGPYGNFVRFSFALLYNCPNITHSVLLSQGNGGFYEESVTECGWNKTWVPSTLDPCVATSCQQIPFPPERIGLVYTPDEKNNITVASEFSVYNPTLPMVMKFKGREFCEENQQQMLLVGRMPLVIREKPELIFRGNGTDEAFHIRIDLDAE